MGWDFGLASSSKNFTLSFSFFISLHNSEMLIRVSSRVFSEKCETHSSIVPKELSDFILSGTEMGGRGQQWKPEGSPRRREEGNGSQSNGKGSQGNNSTGQGPWKSVPAGGFLCPVKTDPTSDTSIVEWEGKGEL